MSKRSERFFETLSKIDERKIDEAAPVESKKRSYWKRWGAIAAALVLVIGVSGYALSQLGGSAGSPGNSAGEGGADGGSTFMSYAGPVFPLTLKEEDSAVTARREITLDFAPWVPVWWSNEEEAASRTELTPEQRQEVLDSYNEWYPEGGRWRSSKDILVTDAYTLTNTSEADRTVTVLYPFASDLQNVEQQMPALAADGVRLETVLYAGDYSGGFAAADAGGGVRLNSWEDYRTLMEGGGYRYQQSAFASDPDLSGVPVVVYAFTNARGDGTDAAAIQAGFELDYEKTQVLSFGFNGGSFHQEEGWMGMSFFIPQPQWPGYGTPCYLIVLGDDIGEMTVQGYANLGCEAGDERDFTVDVRRYETSLEDILRELAEEMYGWEEDLKADFGVYFGLLKENVAACGILSDDPAEWYHISRLSDLDFRYRDQVFYLEAEVTVPAGRSVTLAAEMAKESSYDFHCAHTADQGVCGYDMVTRLGSNLTCTVQSVILMDRGQIEIVRQNFGFDLKNSVKKVTLDPSGEHYYLEVKRREVQSEK